MGFKDLSVPDKFEYIEDKGSIMNDGRWKMLAGAIVEQAMKDYRLVLKGLRRNPKNNRFLYHKSELEDFFRSQWYRDLTNIDGEKLMQKMQEEYL